MFITIYKQRALAREIVKAKTPSQHRSSFQYRKSWIGHSGIVIPVDIAVNELNENGTDDTRRINSLREAVESPNIDAKMALRNVYSTPRATDSLSEDADSENDESLEDGDKDKEMGIEQALEALNHRKKDQSKISNESESDDLPSGSAQLELRLSQQFSSEELKHQKEEMLDEMQSLLEKERVRCTPPDTTSPLAVINQSAI